MGLVNEYTEEEHAEFQRDVEQMYRDEAERERKDQRVLRKQQRKLAPYLFSQLKWILDFHETTWDYKIVAKLGKGASKEIDDYHSLRHLFTDVEYQSYDIGEISCGGDVYVPIKNGNYFKFSFGM